MKLHPKQEELLMLLEKNQESPLSLSELVEAMNVSSNNLVLHHLKQLEKKGYLKRNPYNPSNYQILTSAENPVSYVNFYGKAQCGKGGCILDDNPEDRIPISSKLINFSVDRAFMIKARGDSMSPIIVEGDIVIAQRKQEFLNDDVVVCSVNGGEVMIKQFVKEADYVLLKSFNHQKHPTIFISKKDEPPILIGKVEQIIRNRIVLPKIH